MVVLAAAREREEKTRDREDEDAARVDSPAHDAGRRRTMDRPSGSGSSSERPPSRPVLSPVERTSEVLFALIMTLTFTLSISAAEGKREEVGVLLFAALSCNVAWGLVDGVMYLMGCLADRGAAWRAGRAFCEAKGVAEAHAAIRAVLPGAIAAAAGPEEVEAIRASLQRKWVDPPPPGLSARDWRGALGVFLLVVLTTFPVAIPFLVFHDAERALRVSNAVAIVLLFVVGRAFGHAAGIRPRVSGLAMVAVGVVLTGVTIALGG
jgi:hypothetical protein